ncbi:hypothetical protein BDR26DRAFT_897588 [Obelidium mucronatum]|nr:hypothetical protein BDR26DRAFT_897588 [Obelidium mucronatum]
MTYYHSDTATNSSNGAGLNSQDVTMQEGCDPLNTDMDSLLNFLQSGDGQNTGPGTDMPLGGPGGMSSHILTSANGGASLFGSNMLGDLMSPFTYSYMTMDDTEQFLHTPIISPAITPSVDFSNMSLQSGSFSPISSPALRPSTQSDFSGISTNPGVKRATRRTSTQSGAGGAVAVERKKKIPPRSPYTIPRSNPSIGVDPLRISSPIMKPTIPRKSNSLSPEISSPGPSNDGKSIFPNSSVAARDPLFKVPNLPASRMDSRDSKTSDRSSLNEVKATNEPENGVNAVTPGMLLYLRSDDEKEAASGQSEVTSVVSKPASSSTGRRRSTVAALDKGKFVSPSLKPLLPATTSDSREAINKLTHNSNYRNILEGESDLIGFDATEMTFELESKKEHHKVSEQKRRDSMKQNFDNLKVVLPQFSDKNPSKEKVLQFSREYILKLKQRIEENEATIAAQKRKDEENERVIQELRAEIVALRNETE